MPFSTITYFSDVWGGKGVAICDVPGPASYVTGGESIDPRAFGVNEIEFAVGSDSSNGTYTLRCRPTGTGHCKFTAVWIVVATGQEVAAGTNLSASVAKVWAFGG